jgi:hypothetical protein
MPLRTKKKPKFPATAAKTSVFDCVAGIVGRFRCGAQHPDGQHAETGRKPEQAKKDDQHDEKSSEAAREWRCPAEKKLKACRIRALHC